MPKSKSVNKPLALSDLKVFPSVVSVITSTCYKYGLAKRNIPIRPGSISGLCGPACLQKSIYIGYIPLTIHQCYYHKR